MLGLSKLENFSLFGGIFGLIVILMSTNHSSAQSSFTPLTESDGRIVLIAKLADTGYLSEDTQSITGGDEGCRKFIETYTNFSKYPTRKFACLTTNGIKLFEVNAKTAYKIFDGTSTISYTQDEHATN